MTSAELVVSTNGEYTAEVLPYSTTWMIGDINKDNRQTAEDIRRSVVHAMDSIEPVAEDQAEGSTCTDSRRRLGLINGDQLLGVAPQAVGGTLMTAFVAAEALGTRLYPDSVVDGSSEVRLQYVADFMSSAGLIIGRHVNCGGVNGFVEVQRNGVRFALAGRSYIDRLSRLVPESIADQKTHIPIIAAAAGQRVSRGLYADYSSDIVERVVEEAAAKCGKGPIVERLMDDGRGVHGHRESLIMNLAWDLGGVAINPNTLNTKYDTQAFGVNGELLNRIALALSNDGSIEEDFVTAWFAMKHFTASAHGSLGSDLVTALVRRS